MRQSAVGPFKVGPIFGRFLKNFPRSPFALFHKKRVWGDLAKIAITCPFGHFWSRCFRQKLLQFLQFKCILIRRQCPFHQSAFGPFKQGLLFGRLLKNFPWSPLSTFSENAGFGLPCENCHNLGIPVLWSRCFR